MDIQEYASSLIGVVTPLVTQLIRNKVLPWSGKAALYLSFAVSLGCVSAAYFSIDSTPTVGEFVGNVGLAFTLSQVVYRQFSDKLKSN